MNIARYRAKLPGLLPAGEGAWRSQPGRPGETAEPAGQARGNGGASRAGPGKRRSQPHVDVNSHVDTKKASGTSSSPEASIKNGSYL
ncbi:hypothetical protein, partial [Phocaeicola dorei]|uniref:hypothetical protein n=1 Tax=Phocaeicola dorei TaxID=357276 RepID=UPI0032ECDF7B